MRILEEKESSDREKSFRKRMREIDQREKEIEKRERQMKKEREHEELLCQKIKERFDRKDQPHIIRRQLQEIQQKAGETPEEFAERIEDLSTEAYPDSPEFFRITIIIDAF